MEENKFSPEENNVKENEETSAELPATLDTPVLPEESVPKVYRWDYSEYTEERSKKERNKALYF